MAWAYDISFSDARSLKVHLRQEILACRLPGGDPRHRKRDSHAYEGRESCILGKIFIEDIDGNGTLTANWCFGVGEIRLVASEGCATKTGDFP